jgi:energy-coupling factor transporter ATP-binding protein EcfA2
LEAVEDRIEADLARGQLQGLTGELAALLTEHPLRERLHERILRQDPSLEPPSRADPIPPPLALRNPYRGLQPFTEADAADFFGREELVRDVVVRCQHERLLTLVGPSGCGKSSIVRAGVVPALRRGSAPSGPPWLIATMVPGAHPFEALEAALLRAAPSPPPSLREQQRGDDLDVLRAVLWVRPDEGTPLLLVIDQFEELYLLVRDDAERRRFARNLVEAVEDPAARLTVVLTLRADLLDRPLDEPGLGELVVAGLVTVPPLTPAQLEEASVRPAAGVGVTVEPELAAELVADVAERPGALPLFEYALTELFEARVGDALTLEAYRGIGGLRGALARRADETYDRLAAHEREAARQVLLRLVTIGEGAEDACHRVRREELDELGLDPATVAAVLDGFGGARLLAFDRDPVAGAPTVEVAHEALLRAWPRLRAWIDGTREDLRLHGSLASAAAEWERTGRDPAYLLTGSRLALYGSWTEETTLALSETERRDLAASQERHESVREEERRRHRRELELERRARGRLRALSVVLAVAVLVASGLTAIAVRQTRVAEAGRSEAVVLRDAARVRQLSAAAVSVRETDPELSLLLAMYAVAIAQEAGQAVVAETVEALHWGLPHRPRRLQTDRDLAASGSNLALAVPRRVPKVPGRYRERRRSVG